MQTTDITIHHSFLPHDDPEESLAFYRDVLGFEVRLDVGGGKMRWITVGPPDQPDTSIVLHPVAADPGINDDERRLIAEMMAKGTYAMVVEVLMTRGCVHPLRVVPIATMPRASSCQAFCRITWRSDGVPRSDAMPRSRRATWLARNRFRG